MGSNEAIDKQVALSAMAGYACQVLTPRWRNFCQRQPKPVVTTLGRPTGDLPADWLTGFYDQALTRRLSCRNAAA